MSGGKYSHARTYDISRLEYTSYGMTAVATSGKTRCTFRSLYMYILQPSRVGGLVSLESKSITHHASMNICISWASVSVVSCPINRLDRGSTLVPRLLYTCICPCFYDQDLVGNTSLEKVDGAEVEVRPETLNVSSDKAIHFVCIYIAVATPLPGKLENSGQIHPAIYIYM